MREMSFKQAKKWKDYLVDKKTKQIKFDDFPQTDRLKKDLADAIKVIPISDKPQSKIWAYDSCNIEKTHLGNFTIINFLTSNIQRISTSKNGNLWIIFKFPHELDKFMDNNTLRIQEI